MNEDLSGRVENTTLPAYKSLLPLFDAVINAIHAIEERRRLRPGTERGTVTITVHRESPSGPTQKTMDGRQQALGEEPLNGFTVEDDGIGFDAANRKSFDTADSRYKKTRGYAAKGVGRFLWLKAFASVTVDSTYLNDQQQLARRTFSFRLPEGIAEEKDVALDATPGPVRTGTKLELMGFAQPYRSKCPKRVQSIADRIVEHCFVMLLRPNAPAVILVDQQEKLYLHEIAHSHQKAATDPQPFEVKGQQLTIQHFHVADKSAKSLLHLIADEREVLSEPPHDPNINQRIPDGAGGSFVVVSYVSGSVLDSSLNSERTAFGLPRREEQEAQVELFDRDLTLEDLLDAAHEQVAVYAEPLVAPLQAQKFERIEQTIRTRYPQYVPLLKHRDELARLPPHLPEERLEVELHKIRAKLAIDTTARVRELLKDTTWEGYEARSEQVLAQLNDVGKAALIENVVHRKLVLEILSKHLARRANSEPGYYLEEDIHRIIFPMRTTSEDVPFDAQNLWVIDERLTFHRYLASDKRLNEMSVLDSEERDRPDIVIWNNPVALSEEPSAPTQQAITVVEFKRPMREQYAGDKEYPSEQVTRYVREIQEDQALDRSGRPIRVHESSPFFAYVLCDLTNQIRNWLIDHAFIETPDRQGFFFYNQNRRLWIEVLSYSKVVDDARKRNRALFEALQLPN